MYVCMYMHIYIYTHSMKKEFKAPSEISPGFYAIV